MNWIINESADFYHAQSKSGKYMSSHMLGDFRSSPLLYRKKVLGQIEEKSSTAYALGSAAHKLILEGRNAFDEEYVVYGTLLTTLIVYLFAEMLPKSLAKARSEEIALAFAGSMVFFVKLLTPISALFSGISALLSRIFSSGEEKTVTEEDLINIIETIEDEGVLEPEQQELLNSAMEFREKKAADVMIPIEYVVSVSSTTPLKELAELVKVSPYSRLPVYEGSADNIVGILPVNLFLSHYVAKKPIVLRKILLKPYVFDAQTEISVLLQRMRLNKLHMVFLTDETKTKVGIITMEDLLEELVGDIQDESDTGEGLRLQ
jgi:CBS domain containing-hemolysin-like protein